MTDTREVNPGEVWEENEFWIELSWRIDPDGSLGVRQYHESRERPGEKLTVDEYYGWMFSHSVPGLPERAAAEGLSPLEWMRRYGAFEISRGQGAVHEQEVPAAELSDVSRRPARAGVLGGAAGGRPEHRAGRAPPPDDGGPAARRGHGRRRGPARVPDAVAGGWSSGPRRWPPGAGPSTRCPATSAATCTRRRLAEGQVVLLSTFRLPTQIHTRSANAKWLDELAHTNPVWIHPADAARFGVGRTGDLVRVETEIGHFVAKAWITEGIRPGVVACSHHMGRWRLDGGPRGAGGMMATVGLSRGDDGWQMERRAPAGPYESADPDSQRIWWTDTGVHQNLTFGVHPDPISGMHCWHQAVRIRPAEPGDRHGDIAVDTGRARQVYRDWLALARPAAQVSPDGTPPPALADAAAEAVRRGVRPARRGPGSPRDGRIGRRRAGRSCSAPSARSQAIRPTRAPPVPPWACRSLATRSTPRCSCSTARLTPRCTWAPRAASAARRPTGWPGSGGPSACRPRPSQIT